MVIGFNLIYLQPGIVGGTEIYARELIREISKRKEHKLVIFCGLEAAATFTPNDHLIIVKITDKPFSQLNRLYNENVTMNKIINDYSLDILFSPSGIAIPLLLNTNIPQVCTAHDLQHIHLKGNFSLGRRIARTILYATSYWCSKRIIAISEFTRKDVIEQFRVAPHIITTIHHGTFDDFSPPSDEDKEGVRKKFNLDGRFFYYPAAMHRHKNHLKILEYFADAREKLGEEINLVFTGPKSEMFDKVQEKIMDLHIKEQVRHFGYVNRQEVFSLMALSEAVLFPSEFEGFGMPVLEAMQCGAPVISSNRTSLQEIADEAALLLDPDDGEGWREAMISLVGDSQLKNDLIRKGYQNVRRFSWSQCAQKTLAVLQEAVNFIHG